MDSALVDNSLDVLSLLILLILIFLGALRIQAYLIKRAVSQVIDRFRKNNCLCSQGSKSIDELGLRSPNLLERFYKPRDYKPYALQLLIQAKIVRLSDDDRMCLNDKKLKYIQ